MVHVLCALLLLAAAPDQEIARARALEEQAHGFQSAGRYADAEKPLLQAIAVWTRLRGPQDIEVLNDQVNLAAAYRRGGDAARAVPLLEKASKNLESSADPDAPGLRLSALNNLAIAYQYIGRLGDARGALEKVLAALGNGAPAVERARVLDNLSAVLLDQGDLASAEPYAERALAEWKSLRGEDDLDVGISMSAVGTVRMRQSRFDEARPYLEALFASRRRPAGRTTPRSRRR